jgi:hypothetical protein
VADEGIRDDVLMRLVDHAMGDADFRQSAQRDPEGTLRAHGYELTDEELAAVKDFQSEVAEHSDDELQQAIAGGAGERRQGS